ncbi:MAG: DUF4340 domain-containing protein [Clostridia bacterium]|nr:DUF4340 domain-containing protein [Clostridia bacterium]
MDKKLRNILILAGILILLCVGYAVVGLVFPEEETETTDGQDNGETSRPLLTVTEDGLTALSFTYDADGDGAAELWAYTRSADGETWSWADDPAVPLSGSAFYGYSSTLASITSVKTITDVSEAQLEEFGLKEPRKTITFTDAVGGTQGFCVGAYNTYNGTYCAYKQGNPHTVYLLEGEFYPEFERGVTSLVSFDDLPSFAAEALVSLTLADGTRTVTVTRSTPQDTASPAVWYRSVDGAAPVAIASDLGGSLELLTGDMDYLTCYSVKAEDFSEYGLDGDTLRMTVIYKKTVEGEEREVTFTLTLGSTDKYGYYYARPDGTTLTMLLGGSVFHKVMTYDDGQISAGDAAETDTAAGD